MKVKIPKNFDFEQGTYKGIKYYKVDHPEGKWDSDTGKTVYEIDGYDTYTTKKYGGLFLEIFTGDDYPHCFDADSLLDLSNLLNILQTQYPLKETENENK